VVVDQPRVEVVWYELDESDAVVDKLASSLDDVERHRVERLSDPIERRRTTVRFARRREILASLRLGPDVPTASPRWSSSSRHGLGLLAVSSGPRVGVDIEASSEIPDPVRLAASIATDEEATALDAATPSERADQVLRLWTRKEAYLKATGEGITGGLAHVEVPLDEGHWGTRWCPVGEPSWFLYDLVCPRPELVAAVVVGPASEGLGSDVAPTLHVSAG
jgi:4'-phosphopantetheinyl transferase superfamily